MKYTPEQFDEAYNKLPETIQDFVMSDDVAESIDMIAEEFGITDEEKIEEFAMDIFALVVGIGSIDTFVEELHSVYNLDEEKANDLLLDVDDLILAPTSYLLDEENGSSNIASSQRPSSPQPITSTPRYIPPKTPEVSYSSEHPVPLIPKQSVPAQTSSQPTTTPRFTAPQPQFQVPKPQPKPQEAPSIMNTRLNSSTIVPAEEIIIGSPKPEEKKPSTYSEVDPYREPPAP